MEPSSALAPSVYSTRRHLDRHSYVIFFASSFDDLSPLSVCHCNRVSTADGRILTSKKKHVLIIMMMAHTAGSVVIGAFVSQLSLFFLEPVLFVPFLRRQ